jgi:RNA recognition motif-containing protein
MSKKVFVGNLSWKTTEEELRQFFEEFGEVVSAKIVIDQMTGRSKGFGFVEMKNAEDAARAIDSLNGRDLGGRPIRTSLAQDRASSAPRAPRGNGGEYRSFRG